MTKVQSTINLVLKVMAIGMAVPSLILVLLDLASLETSVILLSIGLLSLTTVCVNDFETLFSIN